MGTQEPEQEQPNIKDSKIVGETSIKYFDAASGIRSEPYDHILGSGYEEIAKALDISLESARVSASRYVKQGLLIRVKRNLYVLDEKWQALDEQDKFYLANISQVPSYISLMTAMGYYDITTQIQQNYIESIGLKRTKQIDTRGLIFSYSKISGSLYFSFIKKSNFFIASPEKAFIDALYLKSLRRYDFDLTSIDIGKMNMDKVKQLIKKFPKKTQNMLELL